MNTTIQPELSARPSAQIRSLFSEFNLHTLTITPKAATKRASKPRARKVVPFTPADDKDLSMFGYDYSI